MKKEKSLDEIAIIEKAIKDKYGEESITNPASFWNQDKEKEYLNQLKNLITQEEKENVENKDGFNLISKLITKNISVCPICDFYGLNNIDDMYMLKFGCCEKCYILYVEGNEPIWEEKKKKLLEGKVKNENK